MTVSSPLFALIAGEVSGDNLGADLVRALREHYPAARFVGVTGPRMQGEGVESLYSIDRLSLMGITEILPKLPGLLRMRRDLEACLVDMQPDAVITIDAPDFNLRLSSGLHRNGLRTVHYVSPTVWAWRQGRVKGIRKSIDLMLTLFPFEARFYEEHDVPVRCVGHPLADQIPLQVDTGAARTALDIPVRSQVLAILPGSRMSEVEKLLPDFLDAAKLLRDQRPELQLVIPAATPLLAERIREMLQERALEGARLFEGRAREVISAADVVLLASGTATLETMLLKKPMVVGYRVGAMTYRIVRAMTSVNHVAMPNFLFPEPLIPEYLQDELNGTNLAAAVNAWLDDPRRVADYQQQCRETHRGLQLDASRSAAGAIRNLIDA